MARSAPAQGGRFAGAANFSLLAPDQPRQLFMTTDGTDDTDTNIREICAIRHGALFPGWMLDVWRFFLLPFQHLSVSAFQQRAPGFGDQNVIDPGCALGVLRC